jgi:hypothetical protein
MKSFILLFLFLLFVDNFSYTIKCIIVGNIYWVILSFIATILNLINIMLHISGEGK